jgi:hypothetical protein
LDRGFEIALFVAEFLRATAQQERPDERKERLKGIASQPVV